VAARAGGKLKGGVPTFVGGYQDSKLNVREYSA
jgi:hypothetical protein